MYLRLRACSGVTSHRIQLIWQITAQTPCGRGADIYIPSKRQHFNLYIFIFISIYSYCVFMYLHRASWNSSATLTEVFPCLFLSCKANARVKPAKMGHGQHSSKIFVLFLLCRSVYCLCVCVNVYCTTATGWLPNCSQQIYLISYCGYSSASLFIRLISI